MAQLVFFKERQELFRTISSFKWWFCNGDIIVASSDQCTPCWKRKQASLTPDSSVACFISGSACEAAQVGQHRADCFVFCCTPIVELGDQLAIIGCNLCPPSKVFYFQHSSNIACFAINCRFAIQQTTKVHFWLYWGEGNKTKTVLNWILNIRNQLQQVIFPLKHVSCSSGQSSWGIIANRMNKLS